MKRMKSFGQQVPRWCAKQQCGIDLTPEDKLERMNHLLAFYRGNAAYMSSTGPIFFSDFLNFNILEMEQKHDWVQWVWPLMEPSDFNRNAPLLDVDTIDVFHSDSTIQWNIEAAFLKTCKFLSLGFSDSQRSFNISATNDLHWITPGNHNQRRITRVLTSLRLLGREEHASALFKFLCTWRTIPFQTGFLRFGTKRRLRHWIN